jgi:hypothetical protein
LLNCEIPQQLVPETRSVILGPMASAALGLGPRRT